MRYRWRDLPSLLKTAQGRRSLRAGQLARFWPVIRLFSLLWRRTVLRRLKVVAVIGSLGKSTTARAVAVALDRALPDGVSNSGNALAFDLLRHSPPDRYAVLEAAVNGPGKMKRLAAMLHPDIVVVTSISGEHLLSFGTLENTRREKAEMLRRLSPAETVILNADDPSVMWMAGRTKAGIITCGFSPSADIRATDYRMIPPGGIAFQVRVEGRIYPVCLPLLGRHMVFPVLAAIAVAWREGRDPAGTCRKLETMEALRGRMQAVRLASGALLIRDDFKSNRESLQAALQVLRDYPATRKILVLGGVAEIPSREQYQYFRQLGREIAASVDHAVLFLRKNSFRRCRNQALEAGMDPGSLVRAEEDPLSALPHIPSPLGEGDLILVKGRNEYRTARLSLALAGNRVTCRLASCRVPVDCDDCELLAGDDRENPLLAPNLNKTK